MKILEGRYEGGQQDGSDGMLWNFGKGKVFYTNLGHNETTWTNHRFLASVEGAVRWVLGLEPGDATPNPEVSKAEEAKAQAAAKSEEPHS